MWFLRRIVRISWTDQISNERVLTIVNVRRKLLHTIKNRKMTFLEYVMQRKDIENLLLTRKIEGKRAPSKNGLTGKMEMSSFKHVKIEKFGGA